MSCGPHPACAAYHNSATSVKQFTNSMRVHEVPARAGRALVMLLALAFTPRAASTQYRDDLGVGGIGRLRCLLGGPLGGALPAPGATTSGCRRPCRADTSSRPDRTRCPPKVRISTVESHPRTVILSAREARVDAHDCPIVMGAGGERLN